MTTEVLQKIVKSSPHLSWIDGRTVYLTRHGSKAYGTDTPESDEDFKGICIPTKEYYLGSTKKFEQAELNDPDTVIYEIRKFFNLAAQSNPNVIEVLFADSSDHIYIDPIGEIILDHRNDFLSKKVKHTMTGYAMSQLHRIKLHRRWLLNPPKQYPSRAALGLPEQTLIPQDQLSAAMAEIQKELDKLQFDLDGLEEPTKINIRNAVVEVLAELKISADDQWLAAARKIGFSDNFIELAQKERQYATTKREWEQYQNWRKTRNPKRAADEKKFGYDCYAEETEFLTDTGWKKFDDVSAADKLATVYMGQATNRQFQGIEYQSYIDRFDGIFTGNMYNLYGNHIDVMITPNHRMLIQKEERKSKKQSEWSLEEAAHLPDTFNIIRQISPKLKNYNDEQIFNFDETGLPDQAFLRLIGWYLSDGAVSFSHDKTYADTLNISQIKNGKLYSSMKKFYNKYSKKGIKCSFYEYEKEPNIFNSEKHIESILSVRGNIPDIIFKNCGNVSNKRIPRWCFLLSKYKMEILLDAMIGGDGTKFRPDNSIIYYSSLKKLADDVQELALLCGFETSLYGPYKQVRVYKDKTYETDMYQVHINKTRSSSKKMIRSKNINKVSVSNKRIVCFTVPNGTLITRYNGHIGIHGNSKHAYHLVRLMRMAREILTTGKVIVKRPDRDELLSIRNGAWSFEQLMEFALQEDMALNELYTSCILVPKAPNHQKLDELCIKLVEKSLSKYSWYNIRKSFKV